MLFPGEVPEEKQGHDNAYHNEDDLLVALVGKYLQAGGTRTFTLYYLVMRTTPRYLVMRTTPYHLVMSTTPYYLVMITTSTTTCYLVMSKNPK